MPSNAAADPTTDVVATPHANSRYRYDHALIDQQIAELNRSVQGIRIHRGCDFSLQTSNIDDAVAHPEKYTINGLQYLMVEFPDIPVYTNHDAVLDHLLDARLIPIVTHPERNAAIRRRPERVARSVESGCYVEVTAGAILGTFGKGARGSATHLLSRGLAHFVASDAHDCTHRPPMLSVAYQAVAREWGAQVARALFVENPGAVIRGEPLDVPAAPPRRPRRWYQVWK